MPAPTAQIDAAIREYLSSTAVTGLSIAVAQHGVMVFSAGYGVQDHDTMQPVTPATLFHLGSVVKTMTSTASRKSVSGSDQRPRTNDQRRALGPWSFVLGPTPNGLPKSSTSTAIMQLYEAGRIDLDDPVVAHLPYFCVADPRSDQITIRQCLSHTSGIPHPDDWGWDRPAFDDAALERHVRSLADQALIAIQPGKTSYSDDAYNVLGALIAHVSGMSYEAYLRQHLFTPLGMTQTTTMAPREGDPALLAAGYEHDDAGAVRRSRYPYNRIHVPCGCVASNVREMTRYATAHLRRGELDGARILVPESYETMWAVQVHEPGEESDSALGWWVLQGGSELIVEHYGGDDGFLCHIRLWPERQQSIVVLCNATWAEPGRVTELVAQLLTNA